MVHMKKLLGTISLLLLSVMGVCAQDATYIPTPENIAARKEFQDEKFGIFLHWGVYSMLGDGEWVMWNKRINRHEYDQLPAGFYPSKFNADAWVAAFKAAGAKYITITSRHHDGFSMFKSKVTPYNIVDATPFHRDILKELSQACQKAGIKLHVYYSHMDWYRDDYPMGSTSKELPHDESTTNWKSYYKFMNDQLTEILTNYGPIGAIWFDGMWDHAKETGFDWQLPEQYALIHKLQPACLIGNNHHKVINSGEDFQLFEQDLPGENTTGFSGDQKVSNAVPLETCQTMNKTWGYSITDKDYKSSDELIQRLVRVAGMNGNLLLNIGPRPDGQLPVEAVERLQAIGKWMNQYGSTIYGTRGGIIAPQKWGVTTQKDKTLYVHILNLKESTLLLPIEGKKVLQAQYYMNGTKVKFDKKKDEVLLHLDKIPTDVDEVITIKLK
jgi:alpha-L-fucosidase